jgi:hypothetical protein
MITKSNHETGQFERFNTALKTGLLFNGCIFGMSGDARAGTKFITEFNNKKQNIQSDSVKSKWKLFKEYVKRYKMEGNIDGFELILSCRHKGYPQLYIYNSKKKSISEIDEDWVSIGSGKELLDDMVAEKRKKNEEVILNIISKINLPIDCFPYFYCLFLSELTMGFEVSLLEKMGVGGLFHFYYQTSKGEWRQKPSVFVLMDIDKLNKTVYHYIYRALFIDGFLIVDNPLEEPQRKILTSSFERKDVDFMRPDEQRLLGDTINMKADKNQFYFFCGFGFSKPEFRNKRLFHISKDGRNLVVNEKGVIAEDFKKQLNIILKSI